MKPSSHKTTSTTTTNQEQMRNKVTEVCLSVCKRLQSHFHSFGIRANHCHKWTKLGTVVNLPRRGLPTKIAPRLQWQLIQEMKKNKKQKLRLASKGSECLWMDKYVDCVSPPLALFFFFLSSKASMLISMCVFPLWHIHIHERTPAWWSKHFLLKVNRSNVLIKIPF